MISPRLSCIALVVLAACTTKEARRPDTSAPATATLAGAPVSDAATTRKGIEAIEARQIDAVLHGDSVGAVAGYADDAIVMLPDAKMIKSRVEAMHAFGTLFAGGKATTFTSHIEDLLVVGDYAIETATYDMTIQPKQGKPVHDSGKYLTVWKKQPDGSYKAIRDINNSDGPAK
jgi:ketosteroid isomerase-like protein